MSSESRNPGWSVGRIALYVLHWIIILNFVFEMAYASYMLFVVFSGGGSGPLMGRATEVSFELMMTRRMYATEFWLATGGLAIYLALTEIGPRMKRYRSEQPT